MSAIMLAFYTRRDRTHYLDGSFVGLLADLNPQGQTIATTMHSGCAPRITISH
jgi:hypothetical protein